MQKVLVANDYAIMRDGIRLILKETPDLRVAGTVKHSNELLQKLRERSFDLVLLDIAIPGRSGLELIRMIRAEFRQLPILVFSTQAEEQYAVRALRAGANGYLTRDCDSGMLIEAIRRCADGRMYICQDVAERLARDVAPDGHETPHSRLSDREFQVFGLLIKGHRVSTIADELCLSIKTVSTHKSNILKKLHVGSTAELVHYALHHGFTETYSSSHLT